MAIALLFLKAEQMGYKVTVGEWWRSDAEAERHGFKNSNHRKRLAVDINLFKDGVYLTDSADYEPLGIWWEQQSGEYECAWGGRFSNPDGNHFSYEHEGVR